MDQQQCYRCIDQFVGCGYRTDYRYHHHYLYFRQQLCYRTIFGRNCPRSNISNINVFLPGNYIYLHRCFVRGNME